MKTILSHYGIMALRSEHSSILLSTPAAASLLALQIPGRDSPRVIYFSVSADANLGSSLTAIDPARSFPRKDRVLNYS